MSDSSVQLSGFSATYTSAATRAINLPSCNDRDKVGAGAPRRVAAHAALALQRGVCADCMPPAAARQHGHAPETTALLVTHDRSL